jgi:hypothetical protein
MNDAGGWIWLVIDVGFVAVFAAVLAYGTIWYRRRRTRSDVAAPELRNKK